MRGWEDFLQNSPVKGQRYLTEKTRRIEQARREREEFLEELQRFTEKDLEK